MFLSSPKDVGGFLERDRRTDICQFPSMCPDQELNPQPFGGQADAPLS